jgi:hypothetical protein
MASVFAAFLAERRDCRNKPQPLESGASMLVQARNYHLDDVLSRRVFCIGLLLDSPLRQKKEVERSRAVWG